MVLTYCTICRRVRIDFTEAREMEADFREAEASEEEEFLEMIDKAESEEDIDFLSASIDLKTRRCLTVPEDYKGETWVQLSDQEWGAIQIILSSPNLLYFVENYADYPVICPDCLLKQEAKEVARMN